jgi:hypothetical protein
LLESRYDNKRPDPDFSCMKVVFVEAGETKEEAFAKSGLEERGI